ncbi:haloacid dehalogenase [Methylacidiphilum kamchatkense Kam1]|uniref:phosphoglycolate phosphatase n=1 Tax=Methylacidiphilum kamchatkense Kam1 TaxID=1202785 RepID=A0A0C1RKT3_9BACT|nr:HAD family hydrolase [Methylacidiphilum kamchatkense]KIE58652.1 haloacid dehalogenase [Methylacidiphilum kamchatkense Kam1]QDQ41962.1 phosphoglycolate phosphatase-like HAD superfamily hydrolase [Methylacidiphilum kamchatkense Kam1]
MPKTKHIILWDIDGTLIHSSGSGVRAIFRTINELYNIEVHPKELDYRGRTDLMIAKQILNRCQVPWTPENLSIYRNHYLKVLREELTSQDTGKLCPGILDILQTISTISSVKMGLLTGNFRKAAQIKLSYYRVWTYFSFGLFGDLHESRNYLASMAAELVMAMFGQVIEKKNFWVVGDTPHDVLCAKFAGFTSIAVATGGFSKEELDQYKPDYSFKDLACVKDFFSLFTD